jgi:alpha-aminoadipic semialdehyde synthase
MTTTRPHPFPVIEHHQIWEIPGESLLLQHFPDVPISNVLRLEGLANRNSMDYMDTYSLESDDLRTMLRGTLR